MHVYYINDLSHGVEIVNIFHDHSKIMKVFSGHCKIVNINLRLGGNWDCLPRP